MVVEGYFPIGILTFLGLCNPPEYSTTCRPYEKLLYFLLARKYAGWVPWIQWKMGWNNHSKMAENTWVTIPLRETITKGISFKTWQFFPGGDLDQCDTFTLLILSILVPSTKLPCDFEDSGARNSSPIRKKHHPQAPNRSRNKITPLLNTAGTNGSMPNTKAPLLTTFWGLPGGCNGSQLRPLKFPKKTNFHLGKKTHPMVLQVETWNVSWNMEKPSQLLSAWLHLTW